jgi:hypothetical protein
MRNTIKQNHMIDFLFPVLLFFIFTLSALSVLLMAANVYQSTTEQSLMNYTSITSLSYISEKIHQNDEAGAVTIGKLDGQDALILKHTGEEETYCTYIYVYDQELREFFAKEDADVSVSSGRTILTVEDFSMEQVKDGLFRFSCTDTDGNSASTLVSLRTN